MIKVNVDQIDRISFSVYVTYSTGEVNCTIGDKDYSQPPKKIEVNGVQWSFAHDEYHGSYPIYWHYER